MPFKTFNLLQAVIIPIFILLIGCSRSSHEPLTRTQILLGTYVTITSYDDTLDVQLINSAIGEAFAAIAKVEAMTNPYDPNSEIGKLNRQKDTQRIYFPSREFLELVTSAISVAQKTGDSFDFTLWPVFRLWHFDTDSARVPPSDKIQQMLPNTGYQKASLDSSRLTLEPGVEIDFGGISKGFAVEKARAVLVKQGLQNFIIDAGGNLGIEWHKSEDIQIYVRHPRNEGEFWGQFPLKRSCGIATSGDYQFYFMQDGKRYHHILNPQTGYPAGGAVSASIIAPNAILADGYSTGVFVMGYEAGRRFIEAHSELEGLIIYGEEGNLQTYLSPGIKDKFHQAGMDKD